MRGRSGRFAHAVSGSTGTFAILRIRCAIRPRIAVIAVELLAG